MSNEQNEEELRLKPFKFKKGHPICPFCFEPAQTVKIEEGAIWYTCPCKTWQRAYSNSSKNGGKK